VIGVDGHDVVVPGDRPIGAELALGRQVDGIFGPQALEVPPHLIGLEQGRLGRIDLVQRRCIGQGPGIARQVRIAVAHLARP
jgi:hypothetical protein